MSNQCVICEEKTETNHLILGSQWLEFCLPCGHKEQLTNQQTGETKTLVEVFNENRKPTERIG
tara:strand:- start:213 stop:401 length:189 start_codon:yes stop_codon:yes gene_type:complete